VLVPVLEPVLAPGQVLVLEPVLAPGQVPVQVQELALVPGLGPVPLARHTPKAPG